MIIGIVAIIAALSRAFAPFASIPVLALAASCVTTTCVLVLAVMLVVCSATFAAISIATLGLLGTLHFLIAPLLLPLCHPLLGFLSVALLFFIVLLGGLVSIALEKSLGQQEVNLHLVISVLQVVLLMQAHHVVEPLGMLTIIDLKHDPQFMIIAFTSVLDGAHVNLLSVEARQEVGHFVA